MSRSEKRNEIQWLRALAASEVVIWHSDLITKHFSGVRIQESLYSAYGGIGVELFFIVSGYIICMRAGAYVDSWSYLKSRILRIYPLYIMFTCLVILAFLINPDWHLADFELTGTSVLKSMLILPQPGFPILGVGWTLEHEMIFYGSVFVLLFMAGRIGESARRVWPFVLGTMGVGGLILGTGASAKFWDFHLLSPYMLAFGFGWLVRSFEEDVGRRHRAVPVAAFLLMFTLGAFASRGPEWALAYRMAIAAAAFAFFVGARSWFNGETMLGRTVSLIGDASFSVYLSHWFVLSIIGKVLGKIGLPAEADLFVRLVGLALCTAVGILSFLLLEKPLDRFLRGGIRSAIVVQGARPVRSRS